MKSSKVVCRAKNPLTCRFHGYALFVEGAGVECPAGLAGALEYSNPVGFPDGFSAELTGPYKVDEGSVEVPALLGVVGSPVGDLAVLSYDRSPFSADAVLSRNGLESRTVILRGFTDGRVYGLIRASRWSESSMLKVFGDDDFTPWRFLVADNSAVSDKDAYSKVLLSSSTDGEKWDKIYDIAQKGGFSSLPPKPETLKGVRDALSPVEADIMETFHNKHSSDTPNAYVDYVRVDEGLLGKGFGAGLYVYMAKELARKDGGVLESSRLMSDDALRVWEQFRDTLPERVSVFSNTDGSDSYVLDYRAERSPLLRNFPTS